MDLLPTAEQQQIVDMAKSFLQREFPVAEALHLTAGTQRIQRDHLAQMAELGWFGIGLDDTLGGVGYGASEEMLLFVELGRNLMPPGLLGNALAAQIAARTNRDTLLNDILAGRIKVAPAVARNTPIAAQATIEGELLAFDSEDADLVLLADPAGAALVAVRCTAAGRGVSLHRPHRGRRGVPR